MPERRTGVYLEPETLLHDPGAGHAESPWRLQTIIDLLRSRKVQNLPLVLTAGRDAAEADLLRVHSEAHVQRVKATKGLRVALDADTQTSPQSYDCALRAAGSAISAVEAVVRGDLHNAFVAARPPGHHAEPDRVMGFCLFNNIAIAAQYARQILGLQRIAIVDFDVHHGNGTESAFWYDPHVLFISTHQAPLYPGSGQLSDVGEGLGRGRTLNLPLSAGHGDAEYDAIYGALIPRVLERFQPELILVSAGYDIAERDPLGGMVVTYDGFARIAGHLVNAAELLCKGRIVFCLEGGYSPEGLEEGVLATLEAMTGAVTVSDPRGPLVRQPLGDVLGYLEAIREFHDV